MFKLNMWDLGVLSAAAEITRGHGIGIAQVDLLISTGLSAANCTSVAECDKEFLKALNDSSPRLSLTFN